MDFDRLGAVDAGAYDLAAGCTGFMYGITQAYGMVESGLSRRALVVGARRVIVTMTATSSAGEPKVVSECTYPLTARGAADVVVTELSVFRLRDGALVLTELSGDATVEQVRAVTGAPFEVDLEDRRAA